MTIVEEIASDSLVFHQTFKRIWPASQRDALFWSHVRQASENTYAVTNHSTTNADYPVSIILFILITLFWSHVRQASENTYAVTNHSTTNADYPASENTYAVTNHSTTNADYPVSIILFILITLFWSHVRQASENTYAVTNHSTTNADYPANNGACIALIRVGGCGLACHTTYPAGETPTRDNITTSIAYCSTEVYVQQQTETAD
ncbi:hypothetical protein SFRURICE_001362 [Spodoptera frugiperda]|nr:hypothetical protein SFRURICE_001362 [Spodoptera frugiperda]